MLRLVAFLGVSVAGLWFGLGRIEREAVYPFDATRVAPAAAGLADVREVTLSDAGQQMIVWVADPSPGQPVILYFHGNAGNLANRASRFQNFLRRGYGLIAPAYRGSSGSSGKPNEKRLTRDMLRVLDDPGRLIEGITLGRVVLYGESLGTGVTLKLLAQRPAARPRAVVLEAPFTSLPDVVRHATPQFTPLIPRMTNIWSSIDHVRALRAPLLVLHGTDDTLIPIAQGRRIFDAAPLQKKQFIAVKGGGHTDLWRSDTLPTVWRFIDMP